MSAEESSQGANARDAARDEQLFDRYLELALKGDAPDPEAFLAEQGGGGPSLERRLRALQRTAQRAPRPDGGGLPFERLGEYRLIERIGRGGMGLVFLAEQETLERRVALKLLRPEYAASPLAAERLKREARTVAKLRHPNIVTMFDFGEERGMRYLAMEYVPGRTLEEELASGPIPTARKLRWIRDLARALDYAHREGVIHRDVKPSNVRITPEDRALLIDFGLVRQAGAETATLTDTFAGSPAYASPEQIRSSASVDARTDVYSLGVTLYRCLTGVAPFEGDSVEQIFHRILSASPLPPRRIDPSLPRDLEVVVLRAIEREPERRYQTAGELADDLDAVMELRPIRARPPSAGQRALRLVRRHPIAAAVVATALVAAAVFAAGAFATAREEASARRAEAARTVEAARARIAEYRRGREQHGSMLGEIERLREQLEFRPLSEDEYAALDARENEVDALGRAWQTTFHEVLELLRRAEQLDPEVAGTELARAELYRERYREAEAALREDELDFYRRLVAQHDPDGRLVREISGDCRLSLDTEPAGAEVYLFRYVDQSSLVVGGEAREVAVPVGGEADAPLPGTWALRVLESRGELRAGDHVLEVEGLPIQGTVLVAIARPPVAVLDRLVSIDGAPVRDGWDVDFVGNGRVDEQGAPLSEREFAFERAGERLVVRGRHLDELGLRVETLDRIAELEERRELAVKVHRDGQILEARLAPGTRARVTASPLFASPACRLGTTALVETALPRGDYLALLRKEGFEDLRVPILARPGTYSLRYRLLPLGSTPEGFVRVARELAGGASDPGWFVGESEITCAEYLEFLNDPRTLAEIAASRLPLRYPRHGGREKAAPLWQREDDGTWTLPDDWRADLPVLGVGWEDARAFARWRSEREPEFTFALPTLDEFVHAGAGGLRRSYTWGARYRAKFARTCHARARAGPGPVRQFPVDESPYGAFDLCGNAGEWLIDWYDEGRNLRHLGGGAWGQAAATTMHLAGGNGVSDGSVTGECGFRLVATRTAEER